ncbi:hypothetical protein HAX54_010385, partial [Datura stramonium]|nr:hypothetical protein [Datura stramonium]
MEKRYHTFDTYNRASSGGKSSSGRSFHQYSTRPIHAEILASEGGQYGRDSYSSGQGFQGFYQRLSDRS